MVAILAAGTLPTMALAPAATAAPGTPISASPIKPETPVDESGTSLGAISSFTQSANVVSLKPAKGAIRVTFLDDGNFRLEATPTGTFTDPANTPESPADATRTANIVVGSAEFKAGNVAVTEANGTIVMTTAKVKLEVNKSTGAFTLKRANGEVVWQERKAIT